MSVTVSVTCPNCGNTVVLTLTPPIEGGFRSFVTIVVRWFLVHSAGFLIMVEFDFIILDPAVDKKDDKFHGG